MRLTLLSLPLLSLLSSQAVWNTGDGAKYAGEWDDEADECVPNETITSAIVADGVVDLSTGDHNVFGEKGVFQYCTKLETVRLPESLRKIGHRVFYKCRALMHVDIPSGVNEFGEYAFAKSSLETVTIPEGIVNLTEFIFWECESLKSVKLPSSLKTIGEWAFYACYALTTINDDALEGVTDIGETAFQLCKSLTTFKLPPLLKTIKNCTFNGCKSLSKVELPPSLERIGYNAFGGCSHPDLIIDLPETVTYIEGRALEKCRIRLPTSLSILTNGGNVEGPLRKVKEVVMSSRVNLGLLVDHINSLPETFLDVLQRESPILDPNLKFKILYSSLTTSTTLPPINQHFPESFFSFDVSTEELKKMHSQSQSQSLQDKVQSAVTDKLSAYACLLQRKTFDIPEEVLYVLLPFLHGDALTTPMLNDIVAEVKAQMGTSTRTTTTTTTTTTTSSSSSETMKKSRKTTRTTATAASSSGTTTKSRKKRVKRG